MRLHNLLQFVVAIIWEVDAGNPQPLIVAGPKEKTHFGKDLPTFDNSGFSHSLNSG